MTDRMRHLPCGQAVNSNKPENKTAVDAVLKQYDALTEEQKALLPTAEKEKIEALKAAFAGPSEEDQQIAEDFTEAVNALPTNKAGEVKAQLDSMTELLSSMTEEQKALIPESTMAAYQEAVDAFEPGRQFCSGDGYYKVLSNGDVTYHHPADKTITSAVVPNQVKKGKFLFKVIKVSNYAFDGCENLLWIVIHSIPFLHPGLERETNRVFYYSCRHHLPSLLLYVHKKRTLASITDVPCC